MMPSLKAFFILPESQEPNLVGIIDGADDFETNESCGFLNQVWALDEGAFHVGGHVIGDSKLAQSNEHR